MRRLRSLSFVMQFVLLSGVLLSLAGTVLAHVLGGLIEDRAQSDAAKTAAVVTSLGIAVNLSPSDFTDGRLSATARSSLGMTLDSISGHQNVEGLLHRLLRAQVYDVDGRVLYSDDDALIGRRFDLENVQTAARGKTTSSIVRLDDTGHPEHAWAGSGGTLSGETALEVFVPLAYGLDRPVGVAEVYLPYAPVQAEIRHDKLLIYGALSVTLLAFYLVMARMVTQTSVRLRTSADRNEYLAHHDTLTGLPNRALLLDRMAQAVEDATRHGGQVGVLLIDLDRFKEVNDTLGHETGDLLLQQVGDRVTEELRAIDCVARLGGDEFVVLLSAVDGVDGASRVANRLLEALHRPFVVSGVDLAVEASIGVACFPEHGAEHGELLQHADVAMYAAKQGRGTYVVYDKDSDVSSLSRIILLNELRRALDEGELVLYYQPKEELDDGRVGSVEALLRWEHPERGLVPPAEFLPVAEQTGLIDRLTQTVLAAAFEQLRRWHDQGRQLVVSVNLSARNLLDPALPDLVAQMAAASGVEPRWLEVEVTETSAMTDPVRASLILTRLSDLGVAVSVDDYGTGYSSLSYLRSLPIDTLKIDRSFVTGMLADEGSAVIVRSTVELAHNLGLKVVAEGVEDLETREALSMLGCHTAQGYYLSRPLPSADLEALLDARVQRGAQRGAQAGAQRGAQPTAPQPISP